MPRRRGAAAIRPLALVGALAVDAALGDPGGSWHPVAVLGRAMGLVYRPWAARRPALQLAGGAAALVLVAGVAGAAGGAAERRVNRVGRFAVPLSALALKPTFALRQLLAEGLAVRSDLERPDLPAARLRLRALVSRPAAELPEALVASAAIESLAENLADSVTAPLLAYAIFGLPGAVVYRAVNTADAMVGYRGELEWTGKAAARADDVLSWVPSRLSALAICGAAGILRGPGGAAAAFARARREGRTTASPNAGRPMAAMAGALGVRLEKPGAYVLGADLRDPAPADIGAAAAITGIAAGLVATLAVALAGAAARVAA